MATETEREAAERDGTPMTIWNNPTKADVRTFGNMDVPGSPAWDTNEGYDAHSSAKTYLPYLNDNPRQLMDVPRCRPVL